MLGMFRSFFQSRIGVIVTLGFLALIAIAFASADVTGNMFGGVAGGDRVATVGKGRIGTGDLRTAVNNAFEGERQKNPTLTMKQFASSEAFDQIIDDLIAREAMMQFGRRNGMVISDRLVDSEIAKIPAFLGPDGKFSQSQYLQLLAQRGLTDQVVRADLANGLVAQQLLVPATYGAGMPDTGVRQYLSLLKERRTGAIAVIPSAAYAPKTPADDATLAKFYNANKARYTQPERRTVRYAVFDESALKNVPAPTEAEIAARYKANSAIYAPSEARNLTQVIVPTEAAAKALIAEVSGGKALETAATSKGLAPAKLERVSKQSLAGQASQAIADAVFATEAGKIAAPGKSPLGWYVVKVDAVIRNPGRTLDQARPEIVTALANEKRKAALGDITAQIDDEFHNGGGLADVAKELGLELVTTAPLTAEGKVFGTAGDQAPAEILPVVKSAFSMDREGDPAIDTLPGGERFVIYEVAQVTESAPAPLDQIKDLVQRDYALDQGSAKAAEAADKVLAQLKKGTSLEAALASLGVPLPPVDPVDLTRQQLSSAQRIPPPLALLFSMAKGSVKKLEAGGKAGWFVVSVKDIIPGEIKPDDVDLAAATRDLGTITGQEYAQQLRTAIRADVAPERNEAAIKAVRDELTGSGQ